MSELVGVLPARNFENITPSDSTRLTAETRGIKIGVAGTIAVANMAGTSVTHSNLAVGIIHPIATSKIFATNTTATDITIYW